MKFGENLKRIRKSKKISQETLAETLGVSRQSISKWETGENYPSMNNIICLCDIFKCKINELVHEDMTDINSLDEEIKMSVVKFKEKEQKRMKEITKTIYIIARIFKVFSIIGLIASLILLISSVVLLPNINFNTNNNTIKVYNKEYNYILNDNEFTVDNQKMLIDITRSEKEVITKYITSKTSYQISFTCILSISLILFLIFLYKMLFHIEKLFININKCNTPFTEDNVNNIKKIALYLALITLAPDILGNITEIIFNINLYVEIDIMNYLFILVVISLAYIFKYGYEIQMDSKGRIYGDEFE